MLSGLFSARLLNGFRGDSKAGGGPSDPGDDGDWKLDSQPRETASLSSESTDPSSSENSSVGGSLQAIFGQRQASSSLQDYQLSKECSSHKGPQRSGIGKPTSLAQTFLASRPSQASPHIALNFTQLPQDELQVKAGSGEFDSFPGSSYASRPSCKCNDIVDTDEPSLVVLCALVRCLLRVRLLAYQLLELYISLEQQGSEGHSQQQAQIALLQRQLWSDTTLDGAFHGLPIVRDQHPGNLQAEILADYQSTLVAQQLDHAWFSVMYLVFSAPLCLDVKESVDVSVVPDDSQLRQVSLLLETCTEPRLIKYLVDELSNVQSVATRMQEMRRECPLLHRGTAEVYQDTRRLIDLTCPKKVQLAWQGRHESRIQELETPGCQVANFVQYSRGAFVGVCRPLRHWQVAQRVLSTLLEYSHHQIRRALHFQKNAAWCKSLIEQRLRPLCLVVAEKAAQKAVACLQRGDLFYPSAEVALAALKCSVGYETGGLQARGSPSSASHSGIIPAGSLLAFADLGVAIVEHLQGNASKGDKQIDAGLAQLVEDFAVAAPDIFGMVMPVTADAKQPSNSSEADSKLHHSACHFLRVAAGLMATQIPQREALGFGIRNQGELRLRLAAALLGSAAFRISLTLRTGECYIEACKRLLSPSAAVLWRWFAVDILRIDALKLPAKGAVIIFLAQAAATIARLHLSDVDVTYVNRNSRNALELVEQCIRAAVGSRILNSIDKCKGRGSGNSAVPSFHSHDWTIKVVQEVMTRSSSASRKTPQSGMTSWPTAQTVAHVVLELQLKAQKTRPLILSRPSSSTSKDSSWQRNDNQIEELTLPSNLDLELVGNLKKVTQVDWLAYNTHSVGRILQCLYAPWKPRVVLPRYFACGRGGVRSPITDTGSPLSPQELQPQLQDTHGTVEDGFQSLCTPSHIKVVAYKAEQNQVDADGKRSRKWRQYAVVKYKRAQYRDHSTRQVGQAIVQGIEQSIQKAQGAYVAALRAREEGKKGHNEQEKLEVNRAARELEWLTRTRQARLAYYRDLYC